MVERSSRGVCSLRSTVFLKLCTKCAVAQACSRPPAVAAEDLPGAAGRCRASCGARLHGMLSVHSAAGSRVPARQTVQACSAPDVHVCARARRYPRRRWTWCAGRAARTATFRRAPAPGGPCWGTLERALSCALERACHAPLLPPAAGPDRSLTWPFAVPRQAKRGTKLLPQTAHADVYPRRRCRSPSRAGQAGHGAAAPDRACPCVRPPQVPVIYPFGHGLSYTSWRYSELSVAAAPEADPRSNGTGCYDVGVTLANTGAACRALACMAATVCSAYAAYIEKPPRVIHQASTVRNSIARVGCCAAGATVRPCAAAGAHCAVWRVRMFWRLVLWGLLKQAPGAVHVLLRGARHTACQSSRHMIMAMHRVCA